jgi:hypothetical protein
MLATIRSVIALVIVALICGVLWRMGYLNAPRTPLTPEEKKIAEKIRLDEANLLCAALDGANNAKDPQQRIAAAITNINLAKQQGQRIETEEGGQKVVEIILDTCTVFQTFETLMIPGEKTSARQFVTNAKAFVGETALDGTMRAVREYMKDPKQFFLANPWEADSVRMIRTTWKLFAPYQDTKGMRASMCRLWGMPDTTAEFFRPKKPAERC